MQLADLLSETLTVKSQEFGRTTAPRYLYGFRILTSSPTQHCLRGLTNPFKPRIILEPVVGALVYKGICDSEDFHSLLDDSTYERYQSSQLERALTLGIGLYDAQRIAIGAYNKAGEGNYIAILISSQQDLIE